MGNASLFACLLWSLLVSLAGAQDVPTQTCRRYYAEGETLVCYCTGVCANSETPTLTWPGESDTDRLEKFNITRQQHGQNFTCQRVCGSQTTHVTYTLQVAYGPDASSTKITGPSPFITNGTLSMTMTCDTTANPTPAYSWSGLTCDNGSNDSACIYTPSIQEDGKRVTCTVINRDSQAKPVTKNFHINLSYPPTGKPLISGYSPDQILRDGDILTCSLTSGKPLGNVTFYCGDPDHQDQDVFSARVDVVIDTSNVTKDMENMTCHCSGHWDPQPDLYNQSEKNASFYTEYPSSLTNFTMNGIANGTLTVNESDNVTVMLQISAYGRPAPRIVVMKNGTEEITSNDQRNMYEFSQVVTHTLSPAECEHTGNYTAFVDKPRNTHPSRSTIVEKTVHLAVNCAPRLSTRSDTNTCPNVIREEGFDLLVVANPPPDDVTVKYLDRDISTLFNINQRPISMCETTLEVRVINFTKLTDGEHKLIVSNTLGSFQCPFKRREKKDGGDGTALSSSTINIIIGVVVGVVFLIILAAIIIFFVVRRRRGRKPPHESRRTKRSCDHEYTNQAFPQNGSDADNDSGIGMNGRSSPPDKNPDSNQAPRYSDGAGYASLSEFTPTKQQEGVLRKKSARTAAYEVTSITPTGQVSIKQAAPQPNAYQEPWDTKKGDMTLAGAPGGPPTPHNVGPKGDEYPTVSNANNKTTITVGPQGDVYSTVAKHGKGDNTQGSPGKAQGPEDAAASRGPPLSMTPHPLDTPGYATLAQMAPAQGNQGDVTSSSGDTATSGSPIKNTSSPGDGADSYDHFQRDGHDPKSTSQGPDVQYSHIGNY